MKGAKSSLRVQSNSFSNFSKVRKTVSAGRKGFLGLRFSEKQQHGTDGGEDSAGRAGDGVDLFGFRIVLFLQGNRSLRKEYR